MASPIYGSPRPPSGIQELGRPESDLQGQASASSKSQAIAIAAGFGDGKDSGRPVDAPPSPTPTLLRTDSATPLIPPGESSVQPGPSQAANFTTTTPYAPPTISSLQFHHPSAVMAPRRIRLRLPASISDRLPAQLRGLPQPAFVIILLLICVNILVWAISGVVLHFYPALIGSAVLSYTLGLRHALDADHISAIDLMTRRLIASGQRPVTVGTFFSLGHSTVVLVTCIVVAATSGALRERFDNFQRVGNIIGTSVSAAFLLILCAGNSWVLYRLVKRLRVVLREDRERRAQQELQGPENSDDDADHAAALQQVPLEGTGFLSRIFRGLFKIVDRPWKMFPLGIMFGLGFDTSSEIAILGIASIQGAQGTSLWLILIFPALFTGMI